MNFYLSVQKEFNTPVKKKGIVSHITEIFRGGSNATKQE